MVTMIVKSNYKIDNHVLAFKAVVLLFDMQLECQNRQQLLTISET